jgi:hypothetical protein
MLTSEDKVMEKIRNKKTAVFVFPKINLYKKKSYGLYI